MIRQRDIKEEIQLGSNTDCRRRKSRILSIDCHTELAIKPKKGIKA